MNDGKPERKLLAGGFFGSITIIATWIVSLFGLDIPTEVGQAITVAMSSAAAWYTP
jgi:hypothetical protein|tara:strand:- start:3270 stop:3437 length:168 start_codon:yes stop_codon:yes gene_type:complete